MERDEVTRTLRQASSIVVLRVLRCVVFWFTYILVHGFLDKVFNCILLMSAGLEPPAILASTRMMRLSNFV